MAQQPQRKEGTSFPLVLAKVWRRPRRAGFGHVHVPELVAVNSTYLGLDPLLCITPRGLMECGGTGGQLLPDHTDKNEEWGVPLRTKLLLLEEEALAMNRRQMSAPPARHFPVFPLPLCSLWVSPVRLQTCLGMMAVN